MSDASRGFLGIKRISVPRQCALAALEHLREVGQYQAEGLALWAGRIEGEGFNVSQTIIPQQRAIRTESGLMFVVEGEELHRLNVYLHDEELRLAVQVHSHPGAAYHSPMDDDYAIVTTVGGLSVVVPDFAEGPLEPANWAVYRLKPQKGWTRLDHDRAAAVLQITD